MDESCEGRAGRPGNRRSSAYARAAVQRRTAVPDEQEEAPVDGDKFDKITRHLAAAQPRRQAVRAMIGGALGAGLAAVGLRGSALGQDQCRNVLERCNEGRQCCDPRDTACKRVSRQCRDETFRGEDRCCLVRGRICSNDCECCRGLFCDRDRNECRET